MRPKEEVDRSKTEICLVLNVSYPISNFAINWYLWPFSH